LGSKVKGQGHREQKNENLLGVKGYAGGKISACSLV